MCRRQCIQCQKAEGGRAVDKDVVVVGQHLGDRLAQACLTMFQRRQFHLSAREFHIGGNDVDEVVRLDDDLAHVFSVDQDAIGRRGEGALVDTKGTGRIPLRIDVDEQNAPFGTRDGGGEIDRRRRFADAALLTGNRNDLCHGIILSTGAVVDVLEKYLCEVQVLGIECFLVVDGVVEVDGDDVSLVVAEHDAREPRDECECRLLAELAGAYAVDDRR